MFILTGHLKGYRKENVDVQINEDGTRICISGEKPVQEMVLRRWMMFKKDVEIRGFKKVFKIPPGVVLDRIKAKYNEHDSILTIFMPKKVKGFLGISIEEVKEEEDRSVRLEQEQKVEDEIPQKIQEFQKDEEILDVGEKSQEMQVETSRVEKDMMAGEIAAEKEMEPETIVEKLAPATQELDKKVYTAETQPDESDLLDVDKREITEVAPEVIESTAVKDEQPVKKHAPQEFADVPQETTTEPEEMVAPETRAEPPMVTAVDSQLMREDEPKTETDEKLRTEPGDVEAEKPEEKIEDKVKKADEEVQAATEEAKPPEIADNEVEKVPELSKPEPQKEEESPALINEASLEQGNQVYESDTQEDRQTESSEEVAEEKVEKATGEDGRDEIRQEIQNAEIPEDKEAKEQKTQDTRSSKEKKRRSRRLCPPLVISGSALLATLLVIVIHFIRSKKR